MRSVFWNQTEVDDFIQVIHALEGGPAESVEKVSVDPNTNGAAECPDCTRLVPELVKTSGVCWRCHVGSVQKGRLK